MADATDDAAESPDAAEVGLRILLQARRTILQSAAPSETVERSDGEDPRRVPMMHEPPKHGALPGTKAKAPNVEGGDAGPLRKRLDDVGRHEPVEVLAERVWAVGDDMQERAQLDAVRRCEPHQPGGTEFVW